MYFCDAGYTLNEIYCEKTLITEPTKKYTCPDDFTVQGQYCKKSKKVSMVEETLNYIKNYGNNSQFENKTDLEIKQIACNYLGGKFSEEDFNQNRDTWCFKYSGTITTGAALVLECNDQYVLNNDQCLFLERINAKYEYYCESGYTLHEDKCLKN